MIVQVKNWKRKLIFEFNGEKERSGWSWKILSILRWNNKQVMNFQSRRRNPKIEGQKQKLNNFNLKWRENRMNCIKIKVIFTVESLYDFKMFKVQEIPPKLKGKHITMRLYLLSSWKQ